MARALAILAIAAVVAVASGKVVEIFPDNDATIQAPWGYIDDDNSEGLANGAAPVTCLMNWGDQTLMHFPIAETLGNGQTIQSAELTVTLLRSNDDIGDESRDADMGIYAHRILAGQWDEGPNYCRIGGEDWSSTQNYSGWCRGSHAYPGSVTRAERVWGDAGTTWNRYRDRYPYSDSIDDDIVEDRMYYGFNDVDFAMESSAYGNFGIWVVHEGENGDPDTVENYYVGDEGLSHWPITLSGDKLADDVADMAANPEKNFGWALRYPSGNELTGGNGWFSGANAFVFASREFNPPDPNLCSARPTLRVTYEGDDATPPGPEYKSPLGQGIRQTPDVEKPKEAHTIEVIASQDAGLVWSDDTYANGAAPVLCLKDNSDSRVLLQFDLDGVADEIDGRKIRDVEIVLNLVRHNDDAGQDDHYTKFEAHRMLDSWSAGTDLHRNEDGMDGGWWNEAAGYCSGGPASTGAATAGYRVYDADTDGEGTPGGVEWHGEGMYFDGEDVESRPSGTGSLGFTDGFNQVINTCGGCLVNHEVAVRGLGLKHDLHDFLNGDAENFGYAVRFHRHTYSSNSDAWMFASTEFVPPGGRRLATKATTMKHHGFRDRGVTTCGVPQHMVQQCTWHREFEFEGDYRADDDYMWNVFDDMHHEFDDAPDFDDWEAPPFDGEFRPRLLIHLEPPSDLAEGESCMEDYNCDGDLMCVGSDGVCTAPATADCAADAGPSEVIVVKKGGKNIYVSPHAPTMDAEAAVRIDGQDMFEVDYDAASGIAINKCAP
mmetsp:Transcript_48870/g.117406  ORF Transcript_48870/g.117406 Transcript_48870/m.117406 type:complete len:772 (-) Transcript_48870:163-2478(-)